MKVGPALAVPLVAIAACRALTGTGDLVVEEAKSGSASGSVGATASSSAGSGGSGGAVTATASVSSSSMTASSSTGFGGGIDSCGGYCSALSDLCDGAHTQYDPAYASTCPDYCAYLIANPDPPADSLACRAQFLPPNGLDCYAAGPGGAGKCGDPCDDFCRKAIFICPGSYIDLPSCISFCTSLPDHLLLTYTAPAPHADTLACRLYYLTREVSAPGVFCSSIKQASNNCM